MMKEAIYWFLVLFAIIIGYLVVNSFGEPGNPIIREINNPTILGGGEIADGLGGGNANVTTNRSVIGDGVFSNLLGRDLPRPYNPITDTISNSRNNTSNTRRSNSFAPQVISNIGSNSRSTTSGGVTYRPVQNTDSSRFSQFEQSSIFDRPETTPAVSGRVYFDPNVGESVPPIKGSVFTPADNTQSIRDDVFQNREVKFLAERYDPSPYRGKVFFLDRTSSFGDKDVQDEYFVLQSSAYGGAIPLTGWKVFSYSDRTAYTFPSGVDTIAPLRVSEIGTLFTAASDTIIVSSGSSPLRTSFRVNKCLGYRQQFKDFVPTIKKNCPDPSTDLRLDETVSFTDASCYDFVDSLRSCESPTETPSRLSNSCLKFIRNTLNEEDCVRLHENDIDFLSQEIRVYLGQRDSLWEEERDALFLLDQNRKLVDVLEY